MLSRIAAYLEAKSGSWSPSTIKSEASRLKRLAPLIDGNPEVLWRHLSEKQAEYTRVTSWTAVTNFWGWHTGRGTDEKANPYSAFRSINARLFRNAYRRQPAPVTFAEAKKRISRIQDPAVQKKALELLSACLRYTESGTYRDGVVTGKGGKVREVVMPEVSGPEWTGSYKQFWSRLTKETGLKPHDLRKIGLTNLADNGVDAFTLCEMAGWSDPKTAMSYINNRRRLQAARVFNRV